MVFLVLLNGHFSNFHRETYFVQYFVLQKFVEVYLINLALQETWKLLITFGEIGPKLVYLTALWIYLPYF